MKPLLTPDNALCAWIGLLAVTWIFVEFLRSRYQYRLRQQSVERAKSRACRDTIKVLVHCEDAAEPDFAGTFTRHEIEEA
jgi:hypothetical protein